MLPRQELRLASLHTTTDRRARAESLKTAWRGGETPNAEAAFLADPDLAHDDAIAVELAYEEYCLREERGESVDTEAYSQRFSFASSIRRLIAVHGFLEAHPDLFGHSPRHWPKLGGLVGDSVVLRELGRGGFSRVYLALETTAGDRPVALKLSARGSTEAATLGPLSHPHLLPVLSSRTVDEWNVVTMPFAGTATLQSLVTSMQTQGTPRRTQTIIDAVECGRMADDPVLAVPPSWRLPPDWSFEQGIISLAVALLEAITYLHERGLAHRDLKPTNVLLGAGGHPYLLDFNLATGATGNLPQAGTVPYMAPEQLLLRADEDKPQLMDWRRCDMFSFGVMFFELLTGQHPFLSAEQVQALDPALLSTTLIYRQQQGHRPVNELNARVPYRVRALINDCLLLDPTARPSAGAALQRLRRCLPRKKQRPLSLLLLMAMGSITLAIAILLPQKFSHRPFDGEEVTVVQRTAFDRGIELHAQAQHSLAATEFLAYGEEENDSLAYACATYCLCLEKNYRLAIAAAEKAEQFGGTDASLLANRAYAYLLTGKLPEALNDCDAAIRLRPNFPAPVLTRAMALVQMHQRKEATISTTLAAELDRAISASKPTADNWMTAAYLYIKVSDLTDRKDRALHAVQEAIRLGKPADALRRSPIVASALSDHPGFASALNTPALSSPRPQNPHLVSPLP
jgi:serine/threonine protein kinase